MVKQNHNKWEDKKILAKCFIIAKNLLRCKNVLILFKGKFEIKTCLKKIVDWHW